MIETAIISYYVAVALLTFVGIVRNCSVGLDNALNGSPLDSQGSRMAGYVVVWATGALTAVAWPAAYLYTAFVTAAGPIQKEMQDITPESFDDL